MAREAPKSPIQTKSFPSNAQEQPKPVILVEKMAADKVPKDKDLMRKLNNIIRGNEEGDVVTLAGSNKGAVMRVEDSRKGKMRRNGRAYLNSNVQGINSSLVFNSTFSLNDPGVHVYGSCD